MAALMLHFGVGTLAKANGIALIASERSSDDGWSARGRLSQLSLIYQRSPLACGSRASIFEVREARLSARIAFDPAVVRV